MSGYLVYCISNEPSGYATELPIDTVDRLDVSLAYCICH